MDQYRFSYEAPLGMIGTHSKPWGGLNDDVSGLLKSLGLQETCPTACEVVRIVFPSPLKFGFDQHFFWPGRLA